MNHDEAVTQAARMWQYFPYRRCFVADKTGEDSVFICKPDARLAKKMARLGWTVVELQRQ